MRSVIFVGYQTLFWIGNVIFALNSFVVLKSDSNLLHVGMYLPILEEQQNTPFN